MSDRARMIADAGTYDDEAHDPLCPWNPAVPALRMCYCDLIARVRADDACKRRHPAHPDKAPS